MTNAEAAKVLGIDSDCIESVRFYNSWLLADTYVAELKKPVPELGHLGDTVLFDIARKFAA